VIGLGAIAPSHFYAIEQARGATLTAVCDIRADVARRVGEERGVPHFTDVGDLLAADLIDVATIGTPNAYHLDPALKVLEAGKHVLVEKPLEITTERIDQLLAAEARSGARIACVFQSRFKPLARTLRSLISDGLLGELYTGSAHIMYYRTQEYYDSGAWRGTWDVDGGGCLMNQGIHCVDLFLWFMGQVEEVIAVTSSAGRHIEVETVAHALATFSNGAHGILDGTTLAYPEYESYIELVGSRGSCAFSADRLRTMDLIDPTPDEAAARETILSDQARRDTEASNAPSKEVAPGTAVGSVDMGHTPIVEDLVEAIREERAPFVTGTEGRRSVAFITAIYESARNGSAPVRLGQ